MFEKKLGEIRPNQLITTYGPGSIMDAVHDSLTVLDIEYWNANNIGPDLVYECTAFLYAKYKGEREYSSGILSLYSCVH